jgi:tryptophan synthase alpha chain
VTAVAPVPSPATLNNRLVRTLAGLRAQRRCALIPYIMAGDPTPEATERFVDTLVASGADAVELGVPFSDPIADGPINQRAGLRAIARGMGLRAALEVVTRLRARATVPLAFMTYYNLILRYGLERFCRDATVAGLDGLIVADLPPEEGGELIAASREVDLATIFLLAPTSTEARIRAVAEACTGFVYCVSRSGVTGVRDELPEGVQDLVLRIREQTATPICVGFGLSRPAQVGEIASVADGVIVGSAIVKMIEDAPEGLDRIGAFVRDLRAAIDAR